MGKPKLTHKKNRANYLIFSFNLKTSHRKLMEQLNINSCLKLQTFTYFIPKWSIEIQYISTKVYLSDYIAYFINYYYSSNGMEYKILPDEHILCTFYRFFNC